MSVSIFLARYFEALELEVTTFQKTALKGVLGKEALVISECSLSWLSPEADVSFELSSISNAAKVLN